MCDRMQYQRPVQEVFIQPYTPTQDIVRPKDLPAHLVQDQFQNGVDAASGMDRITKAFPMRISAYFMGLINAAYDPLGLQVIPHPDELTDLNCPVDPLAEEAQSPVRQVIHRYPHRALFLVSNACAMYCRFCMRKRRVLADRQVLPAQLDEGVNYIRSHSQINEVVLSGGDPLMLDDERLYAILQALGEIDHVRLLRIHTRIPSALPQRITAELADLLAGFKPLYLNIHVNHPSEVTPAFADACELLAEAGICLGSQTVLLKGVNDTSDTLTDLMQALLMIRVRPYYLHQLDRVPGTSHFRVALDQSLKLLGSLRGPLSGMAIPHLMIDLPGGGGKVALTPDAVVRKDRGKWWVRNWQGNLYAYPSDD